MSVGAQLQRQLQHAREQTSLSVTQAFLTNRAGSPCHASSPCHTMDAMSLEPSFTWLGLLLSCAVCTPMIPQPTPLQLGLRKTSAGPKVVDATEESW